MFTVSSKQAALGLEITELCNNCWSCTHPVKWRVFHDIRDLCLVDEDQALGWPEVNQFL